MTEGNVVTPNVIRNVLLPLDVRTDGVPKTLSFTIIIHGHCNTLLITFKIYIFLQLNFLNKF